MLPMGREGRLGILLERRVSFEFVYELCGFLKQSYIVFNIGIMQSIRSSA
jgi:hypothetical protein